MVLVTGGCGFLGRAIALSRARAGRRVVILDDRSSPGAHCPSHESIRWGPVDLSALHHVSALERVLQPLVAPWGGRLSDISEIWHMASPASPPLYKRIPLATLRLGGQTLDLLCQFAALNGAKVIYASSSEIYGDPLVVPTPETEPSRIHPTGPRGMYDSAKIYGEALCKAWHDEANISVRIARIHNTFGPGMARSDGRLMPALIGAALDGTTFRVHGSGEQTRTFGYIDDVVSGLETISVKWNSPEPINVGGAHTLSINELITPVENVLGRSILLESVPAQDEHDPKRRVPDLKRLRSLGWSVQTSLETGIIETAKWLSANR